MTNMHNPTSLRPLSRPLRFPVVPRLLLAGALLAAAAGPLHGQFRVDPEKTDSLLLRNGDYLTGDFLELSRGIVSYKTDAMSTINVKWTRVLTATTDKQFEIHLEDGSVYEGSLKSSPTLGRVIVRAERDTFEVDTRNIVLMGRLKSSFWKRLDGSLDFGFDFTQQNRKTDLSLRMEIGYLFNRNLLGINLDGSFSRQDSATDITRANARLRYSRVLPNRWIMAVITSTEQNSQLSLDIRGTLGAGPGRFWIQSNKVSLGSAILLQVTRERFSGEEARSSVPIGLITDFQFFNWSGLSTDVSSRLVVQPVVTDAGRWQITWTGDLRQEVLSNFYLSVAFTEQFDSKPPSADANKNDFSITTSLGWTF